MAFNYIFVTIKKDIVVHINILGALIGSTRITNRHGKQVIKQNVVNKSMNVFLKPVSLVSVFVSLYA